MVSAGRSGREAIALAARLRPDVVLLHLEMDDVDGIETIPQLKTAQGGRLQVTGTLGTRTRVLARISIEVQA